MRRLSYPTPSQCLGLFIFAWFVLMWVQIDRFTLPGMDSMDYLSAALVAERPFSIHWPLLGSFMGADQVWGIHWPGAPLLESVWLSVLPLPARPPAASAWFLALWAASGALTYVLTFRVTGNGWLAAAGCALLLGDRAFFESVQFGRPEALSCLVLTTAVMMLIGRAEQSGQASMQIVHGVFGRSGWREWIAVLCFFLMPLLHPLTLTIGGALTLRSLVADVRKRRAGLGVVITAAFGLGAVALAGWFLCQPAALAQLQVHSAAARDKASHIGFWPGAILWEALQRNYGVTFSGHLLYGLALMGGLGWAFARLGPRLKPARDGERLETRWVSPNGERPIVVAAVVCFSGLVFAHAFGNPLYLSVFLPCTVVLALVGLRSLAVFFTPRPALFTGLACVGLVTLQTAHLGGRTLKYLHAGSPNVRGDMAEVLRALPLARMTLLPDIFWEAAVVSGQPSHYALATLPFAVADSQRRAYEQARLADTAPGDLLLINTLQFLPLLTLPTSEEWELSGQMQRLYPGRQSWGYDLKIYRRRDNPPPAAPAGKVTPTAP